MQLNFRDKVALLPAASGGLGRAVALELAATGARLAISGRDRDRLEASARDLLTAGASDVFAQAGDCTDAAVADALVLAAGVVNAGLLSLAKGLAEAGARHGILVNTVNPGPSDTDRMRYLVARKTSEECMSEDQARVSFASDIILGRFGRPAEIAAAIAFLASDRASFITGASLNADGGQTRTI